MPYPKQYSVDWVERTITAFWLSYPRAEQRIRVIAKIAQDMGFPVDYEDIRWAVKRCLGSPRHQASWTRFKRLVKCKSLPEKAMIEYFIERLAQILPDWAAERATPDLFSTTRT